MSEIKTPSLKKNFLYRTLFQILTIIVPFITAPYISRVLGAENIGIQSYTESIVAYFSLFAVLGTTTYGTREVAVNRNDKIRTSQLFWEIEALQFITGGIILVGWILFTIFSTDYKIYYIVLTIELASVILDITWFFNGFEQIGFVVLRNTIIRILNVLAIFIFVKQKDDLLIYILITVIAKLLSSVCTYAYLPKFLVRVNHPDFWKNIKRHLKETMVYFIPTISTSLYRFLDKILIGVITKDPAENGYYEQSEKLINMVKQIVFVSINSVVGVRNSYLFGQKKFDEIKQRIEYSMNYIMCMGFACGFGIVAVASRFVPVFYGPGYDQVEYLLYIFAFAPVIIGVSNSLGSQYFNPVGKRKQSAIYVVIGAVTNLILNLILIPHFASYGAAVATIIAQIIISVLYVINSDSYMTFRLLFKIAWKKIVAGITMFAAIFALGKILTQSNIIVLSIQILTGVLLYPAMLLLLRDSFAINLISKVFRKIKREK